MASAQVKSCLLLAALLVGGQAAAAQDIRFPRIDGWRLAAEIQRFVPKTLYEYINGAADLALGILDGFGTGSESSAAYTWISSGSGATCGSYI